MSCRPRHSHKNNNVLSAFEQKRLEPLVRTWSPLLFRASPWLSLYYIGCRTLYIYISRFASFWTWTYIYKEPNFIILFNLVVLSLFGMRNIIFYIYIFGYGFATTITCFWTLVRIEMWLPQGTTFSCEFQLPLPSCWYWSCFRWLRPPFGVNLSS